jgi:hypothetical protein
MRVSRHDAKPRFSGTLFMRAQHGPYSCECKSRRKLTTVSEAKHNCGMATDRGEEA